MKNAKKKISWSALLLAYYKGIVAGHVTLGHLEWLLSLTQRKRDELAILESPVWKTVSIKNGTDEVSLDLIKIDLAWLGFAKGCAYTEDIRKKVKELFGLEPCPEKIENPLVEHGEELKIGCLFIDKSTRTIRGSNENLRVFCLIPKQKLG